MLIQRLIRITSNSVEARCAIAISRWNVLMEQRTVLKSNLGI